jgi:hypothetical protein
MASFAILTSSFALDYLIVPTASQKSISNRGIRYLEPEEAESFIGPTGESQNNVKGNRC